MDIQKNFFGKVNGSDIYKYTMTADSKMSVSIITFGGAITNLFVPDKCGNLTDIVCGYDDLDSYVNGDGYQGALIGRFGNRIGDAKFTLDGAEYLLFKNDGENHLHGGKEGFSHKIWSASPSLSSDACHLDLHYTSPDGEEGYPGTLDVNVRYTLTDNALQISYKANTDKRTVLNLTNHAYFNLGGYNSGDIFGHVVQMDADAFLETDAALIPTGKIVSVECTPFDFREPKSIGKDFECDYEPLKLAGGYDHCMCFTGGVSDSARIKVTHEPSGRVMEVYTDMPCVQFYTGNFMCNEAYPFKNGYTQKKQHAFCLETQKMPDSMNHSGFTNCILSPDETYSSTTVYKFTF